MSNYWTEDNHSQQVNPKQPVNWYNSWQQPQDTSGWQNTPVPWRNDTTYHKQRQQDTESSWQDTARSSWQDTTSTWQHNTTNHQQRQQNTASAWQNQPSHRGSWVGSSTDTLPSHKKPENKLTVLCKHDKSGCDHYRKGTCDFIHTISQDGNTQLLRLTSHLQPNSAARKNMYANANMINALYQACGTTEYNSIFKTLTIAKLEEALSAPPDQSNVPKLPALSSVAEVTTTPIEATRVKAEAVVEAEAEAVVEVVVEAEVEAVVEAEAKAVNTKAVNTKAEAKHNAALIETGLGLQ